MVDALKVQDELKIIMTQKKEKIWSQIVFWAFIHILWSSWGKFTNLPFPGWKERINKPIFCFILIEIKICFARETWRQLRRNWTTTQKHTQTASETITINLDSSCKLSGFFLLPFVVYSNCGPKYCKEVSPRSVFIDDWWGIKNQPINSLMWSTEYRFQK